MIMKKRILVVDDESVLCEVLKINLELAGYEVDTSFSAESALERKLEIYDMLILDVMMENMNGFELAKILRDNPKTADIPIIFCTALDGEADLIKGFNSGADDYVTKPFNPLEIMARIRSLLRRSSQQTAKNVPDKLEVGPITIYKDSHEVVTDSNQKVQLTALEFGVLYLLASHPNRAFSADEIFERVWKQESVVSAKTVMVHVSHLRDKLEEATNGEKVIETVWGVGYKVEV